MKYMEQHDLLTVFAATRVHFMLKYAAKIYKAV